MFLSHEAFATHLVLLLFGDVAQFLDEEERHRVADELVRRMMPRLRGFADVLSYSLSRSRLFADTNARVDATVEPLTGPAPGRTQVRLSPFTSDDSPAPIISVQYVVRRNYKGSEQALDAGEEVHVAPKGPHQAMRRVYQHLRHRWYPVATSVDITNIRLLDASCFPELQRHYTVAGVGGQPKFFPLVARNRAEALQNAGSLNTHLVTVTERPLYIRGRKPRQPVRLGFDHLAM
jgi:hypothetical protein